jgi:hypothetical protein
MVKMACYMQELCSYLLLLALVYFMPALFEALLCALLKQLAEKLCVLYEMLLAISNSEHLLYSKLSQLRLPYAPNRRQLVAVLQLGSQQQQQQQ